VRRDENQLNRYGRLFQEACCTAYAKEEIIRLRYLAQHQDKLRVDKYKCLEDAIDARDHDGGGPVRAGRPATILPSSFTGGPRDMHGRYQDAMAIVRETSRPSWFITATCNPKWPAIQKELKPGQQAQDRPDVIARVFNAMVQELLTDLTKNEILGCPVDAYMYCIEFQKGRCLPHVHILLIVAAANRLHTPEQIDDIISAELPPKPKRADFNSDEAYDAALVKYKQISELVIEFMAHNECGPGREARSVCMKDGVCTKGYAKAFRESTEFREDNTIYPLYRRRAPDNDYICSYAHTNRLVDNRWIVPYSPYLLLKYRCHINVEACASVLAIKYAYKYIYKGPDRAMVAIRGNSLFEPFIIYAFQPLTLKYLKVFKVGYVCTFVRLIMP